MTPIYHMTHVDNLPPILAEGGLVCDAEAEIRGLCKQCIAHNDLKERRAKRGVEKLSSERVAAGGVLCDYVPFYFANRTPMLYSIHTGYVAGYSGGQKAVIYLVSSVETIVKAQVVWCFTNGHAVESMSEFYDKPGDLDKVDWQVIRSWSWKNTLQDLDRKRRKQAEFLIHRRFAWKLVEGIGVMTQDMKKKVEQMLTEKGHTPRVTVEADWYYNR